MKQLIISLIFVSTSVFANYAYTGQNSGKIDMHGGKSDSLTNQGAFGVASTLGSVLNKKSSDDEKIKKDDKKFIEIEKIEKIKDGENK